MLSGLVDNSTLTAVQRVIGDVPVAYSFPIEGDLAAFDQYLQALLIYDEVAALDDYKDEFKAGRHERFKEVRFLNPDNIPYSNASAYASKALEGLQFQIRKGKVATGPLSDFLSSLNLHVSPAWYMQSSDWFLNVRLLADESGLTLEKYSALMSMIQAGGIEANQSSTDLSQRLLIEGSDGEKIDTTSRGHRTVGDDVKQFAQSLNWMAHRAVFYLYL